MQRLCKLSTAHVLLLLSSYLHINLRVMHALKPRVVENAKFVWNIYIYSHAIVHLDILYTYASCLGLVGNKCNLSESHNIYI